MAPFFLATIPGKHDAGHPEGRSDVELHKGVHLLVGQLVQVHGEVVALPDVVDEHTHDKVQRKFILY